MFLWNSFFFLSSACLLPFLFLLSSLISHLFIFIPSFLLLFLFHYCFLLAYFIFLSSLILVSFFDCYLSHFFVLPFPSFISHIIFNPSFFTSFFPSFLFITGYYLLSSLFFLSSFLFFSSIFASTSFSLFALQILINCKSYLHQCLLFSSLFLHLSCSASRKEDGCGCLPEQITENVPVSSSSQHSANRQWYLWWTKFFFCHDLQRHVWRGVCRL